MDLTELTLEHFEALAQRYADAKELVPLVKGPFDAPDQNYHVPSISTGNMNLVTGHPGPLACTCPDYCTRPYLHGGHCKHVLAVMLVTREVAEPSGKVAQQYAEDPELERKIAGLY